MGLASPEKLFGKTVKLHNLASNSPDTIDMFEIPVKSNEEGESKEAHMHREEAKRLENRIQRL